MDANQATDRGDRGPGGPGRAFDPTGDDGAIAALFAALDRQEAEAVEGPHLVVVRDGETLRTWAWGPYPTGLEASSAAEDLRQALGSAAGWCRVSVVPLVAGAPACDGAGPD